MRVLLVLLLLVLGCSRQPATAPTPDATPSYLAIPRSIPSQLGPVPVVVVDSIMGADSTLNLMGGFDPIRRVIYLKREQAPVQKLHTLFHEGCHVWSFDAGLRQLVHPQLMQAICDASASARIAEILALNPGR